MSTLGTMKSRIARELRRTDLTTQIAEAIASAIQHYQKEIFTFTETRGLTFPTVASQEFYDSADNANIPLLIRLDWLRLEHGGHSFKLFRNYDEELELSSGGGTNTGMPSEFSYFNEKFRLYPVPDQVYTVRMAGHFMLAAPAGDSTENNKWMTDGENLIRQHAKYELFLNVLQRPDMVALYTPENENGPVYRARSALRGLRASRGTGRVQAWGF
jgi:hypothetical protein